MTFDRVKEVMIDTLSCDEDKITPEASIAQDLKIDSLDAVELVMALEDEFGVKIPDTELPNMKLVSDVVACVEKYQQVNYGQSENRQGSSERIQGIGFDGI